MKYIFYTIILAATTLSSCIIKSYEKPKKTIVGYNLSKYVISDICIASSIADIARIVDIWRSASTEVEKQNIETRHFDNYIKIREYGDGITIVGYYDFKTSGKSLSESNWIITPLNNLAIDNLTYEVSMTGTNEYLIKTVNSNNESLGELTLKTITPDKEYSILGNSTIDHDYNFTYYDNITYRITTPIDIRFNGKEMILRRWQPNLKQQNGRIDITVNKSEVELEEEKTTAKYSMQGTEITYRKFTDIYPYSEYQYE